MKLLLITVCVLCWGTLNAAELRLWPADKPVSCADTADLLRAISDEPWLETLQWWAEGQDSVISLWQNRETGTWTVLELNGSVSCVLGVGQQQQKLKIQGVDPRKPQ